MKLRYWILTLCTMCIYTAAQEALLQEFKSLTNQFINEKNPAEQEKILNLIKTKIPDAIKNYPNIQDPESGISLAHLLALIGDLQGLQKLISNPLYKKELLYSGGKLYITPLIIALTIDSLTKAPEKKKEFPSFIQIPEIPSLLLGDRKEIISFLAKNTPDEAFGANEVTDITPSFLFFNAFANNDWTLAKKIFQTIIAQLNKLVATNPLIKSQKNFNLLHFAVGFAQKNIVQNIITKTPELLSQSNDEGITPLTAAIRQEAIIQHLPQEVLTDKNFISLYNPNEMKSITQLLLKASTQNTLSSKNNGYIALQAALANKRFDIADSILQKNPAMLTEKLSVNLPDNQTTIIPILFYLTNIYATKKDILTYLINKASQEDLLTKDQDGNTLLHHTVANKDIDISKLLVEKNPQLLREKNNNNDLPIHRLIYDIEKDKTMPILELFVPYLTKDDVSKTNDGNQALITRLIDWKYYSIAEKLFKKYPDLWHTPTDYQPNLLFDVIVSLLHGKAEDQKDLFDFIIKMIPTIPTSIFLSTNSAKRTPLHEILSKKSDLLKPLIKEFIKASPPEVFTMKNYLNKTPQEYAIFNKITDIDFSKETTSLEELVQHLALLAVTIKS